MDRKKFEDLKNYCEKEDFNHLVSWAIWKDDIYDLSLFDEKNLEGLLPKLKENIVIMGLNACDIDNDMGTWEGFHYKHSGGRDPWLSELVKQCPDLEGAYMTDVFKIPVSKSCCLKKTVKDDKIRSREYDKLKKELKILGNNLTIVLIGNDAERYFKKYTKEKEKDGQYRLFKIPHYAARISKRNFIDRAKERLKEI